VTSTDRLSAPLGGFTFVAPTQDACEGDACLLPSSEPLTETAGVTPPR
jgi:hypothetical protein